MNIALTGSSGLIGSLLLNDLRSLGHSILCISSSKSLHDSNIYSYNEVLEGNLKFNADCLFHLASLNSNLSEADIIKEISLSSKAIKCMEALNCKKIIFFSSIKVYGDNSFELKTYDEKSSLQPSCFYGSAKKQCEDFISHEAVKCNFNYTIFRLPPLLINHPDSNLGKIFQVIERGWPIPSFRIGDSNQRSFLSYDTLLEVMTAVSEDVHKLNNETINLNIAQPISTNHLYKIIGKKVGKKVTIIYLPDFLFRLMMRANRLQLLLCRIFGHHYISNTKLKNNFSLTHDL
jgi:UDP-glucose 4-epimerase